MGTDLALLPFDGDDFSHTVLSCKRRQDLFDELGKIHGIPVAKNFKSFMCRIQTEDGYGERLKWVEAQILLTYSDHPGVTDNEKNLAIWAYLKCLDPETPVALYWH